MATKSQSALETRDSAFAKANTLRGSPQKINLVLQMIRGSHVNQAIDYLSTCQKRVSYDISKVLMSAIANAENNHGLDVDSLYVSEAIVGKTFVMKRWHARGRGRTGKINKPYSNIRITVKELEV